MPRDFNHPRGGGLRVYRPHRDRPRITRLVGDAPDQPPRLTPPRSPTGRSDHHRLTPAPVDQPALDIPLTPVLRRTPKLPEPL
eukprot:3211967-Alexandrium_andersonii.AAC.1